jgi:energy-coupling factor transporter ATP-binding protein EcfA2
MIQIRDLCFRYSQDRPFVLDHLNLDVREGEWLVITGDSGCGKSTLALGMSGFLAHMISGEISGSIIINEIDILKESSASISEDVFLVQQNPETQFCALTVREELAFGLENRRIAPVEIEKRIAKALSALNAEDLIDSQINELSGGQQQKVAIATALSLEPKVLILDEPSSNLDPTAMKTLFQTLTDLGNQKILTVIVIEHKPWIFKGLTIRQLVMKKGRLFEKEQPEIIAEMPISFKKNTRIVRNSPVIELHNFRISIQTKQILNIKDVVIFPGEIVSVMGPNGSGKTSLLLSLSGLIGFEAKNHAVFGKPITQKMDKSILKNKGIVFQNPDHQLFCDSVLDEIMFAPENYYKKDINNIWIGSLINKFDLSESLDIHPFHLSYGQKGRLNLASVLSFEPKLLLLDEIFIGQDMNHVLFILDTICQYVKESSATAIIVNHSSWPVFNYASRLIFLDNQEVMIDCPISDACTELVRVNKPEYLPVIQ